MILFKLKNIVNVIVRIIVYISVCFWIFFGILKWLCGISFMLVSIVNICDIVNIFVMMFDMVVIIVKLIVI